MRSTPPYGERFDLTCYLLGLLPEEETEQLDELSVVDDGLAGQLCVAETELVDAYLRGELPGDLAARFKSHYLASPRRRARVAFAGRLLDAVDAVASRTPEPTRPTLWPPPHARSARDVLKMKSVAKENYTPDLSR
jgi:hypothetical protein